MTNEELAVRIRQGEKDLTGELWDQIEKFVRYTANRQLHRLPEGAPVEFGDLYNAGYLAFVRAVELFDAERDASFITLLALTLKTAFLEAAGYRSERQRRDPLHGAISLETPLAGDEDDFSLGDTVTDAGAVAAYESAEERIFQEQLHNEMEDALSQLPERQESVIRRRYYAGDTLQAIGDDLHITQESVRQIEGKALRYLRRPQIRRRLQSFASPEGERRIDQRTNFYYHVGADRFNSTGTSDVEEIVLKREAWREREEERAIDKMLDDIDREVEQLLKERPWLRDKLEELRKQSEAKGGDGLDL